MGKIETIYIRKNDKYIAIQPALDDGDADKSKIYMIKGNRKSGHLSIIFIDSDRLYDLLINHWNTLKDD